VATTALVKRLRLAMQVWVAGALASILSIVSSLIVGMRITPIGFALIGLFAIESIVAYVAAASFGKHLASGNELHARRGLVALGVWLVLAAVATLTFTFGIQLPVFEEPS
jgi:hypothetical protein